MTPQERKLFELALAALRKARRKVLTTEECHAVIMSIKEALAQPEQEPVAWYLPNPDGYDSFFRDHRTIISCTGNPWTGWIPLYTTPPQRTWVGLTDEDCKGMSAGDKAVAMWADRTLKEKNT